MKRKNFIAAALLASVASVFASASAHAQATIDQTKALKGNVTPGDTAGFPVTLSVPGSYKLTGNLVVPAGLAGIEITVSGVTLDLNGFNISGPGSCARDAAFAVTCSGIVAAANGVDMRADGNTVRNGQIRGFYQGVYFYGGGAVIENLLVEHNYLNGLGSPSNEGARTLIRGVRSQLNGGNGFSVADVMIHNSSAGSNGKNGFTVSRGVILDSVAYANKGIGFEGFGSNLALGRSVAQGNKGGDIVTSTSLGGNLNNNSPF